MSRILKVSQSDYRLQVQSGGSIVLDTGTSTGTVIITGNLDVKGTTTTVESTTTTIQDNIIQLNFGQTGAGISSALGYQSGIDIGRGNRDSAQFVFSEQVNHYDSVTATDVVGTFQVKTVNTSNNSTALSGIQVRTITNDGTADLIFDLQGASPVMRIANSANYESRVTDPNHIPNKKFINDYVSATNGIANVDRIKYPLTGTSLALVQATATTVDFVIAGNTKAQISSGGVNINNVSIVNDTITNTSATNLILTSTTNNIDINAVANLFNQSGTPTVVNNATKLYSKSTEGAGRTGIYFVNNVTYGGVAYNQDELVSKNRAVLLSILL